MLVRVALAILPVPRSMKNENFYWSSRHSGGSYWLLYNTRGRLIGTRATYVASGKR